MKKFAAALATLMLFASPALACTAGAECALGDRSYHVMEPEGWDKVTPLPVQLHFHGWARQGEVPMSSPRTGGAAFSAGVLFVAPDGLNKSWDFRRPGSVDTGFAKDILADVAKRFPTEGQPLIVSGYSWGALMAARFACESDVEIDALMLIAGAFPADTTCAPQARRVSHVHGTTDTVLDFPYGPDGDDSYAVALWKGLMDCGPVTRTYEWQAVSWLTHERSEWDCATGLVTMDVHSASHLIPRGWVAQVLSEVLATPN